jgi:hypothetical protein
MEGKERPWLTVIQTICDARFSLTGTAYVTDKKPERDEECGDCRRATAERKRLGFAPANRYLLLVQPEPSSFCM